MTDAITLMIIIGLFILIVLVFLSNIRKQKKLNTVAENQQEIIKLIGQMATEFKETRKEIELMKLKDL